MTTPSASDSAYISREQAAELFDGTADHIYQGDIFHSIEVMVPRAGGTFDSPVSPAMVISHDCEYTKIADQPGKPLLVAPLRTLASFEQRNQIAKGQIYALWALPNEVPLDDAYAVDFRLIQPIAVSQLREELHWACLGRELKEVLHARLARFLLRRVPTS